MFNSVSALSFYQILPQSDVLSPRWVCFIPYWASPLLQYHYFHFHNCSLSPALFLTDSSDNLLNSKWVYSLKPFSLFFFCPTFSDLSGSVKCLLQPRWWGLQLDNALLSFRQWRVAWHSLRSAWQWVDPASGWRGRTARGHGIAGSQSGDCYWSRCGDAGQLVPLRTQQELPR